MATCQCAVPAEDQEFLQHLFQGLSEAITCALQGNTPAQQAQGMTQEQINELLWGQADL